MTKMNRAYLCLWILCVALGLLVICFLLGCGSSQEPWYISGEIELPKFIYTEPIDPNDPIYSVMSQPPDSWNKQFGDSERSAFGYQIALARQQRGELRQMIVDVNDVVSRLNKLIGREKKSK